MREREDDTAIVVDEQALFFESEEDFEKVMDIVTQLSRSEGRQIPFLPLGSRDPNIAVVKNSAYPLLSQVLEDQGIGFETKRVMSIGELSCEERRNFRRTWRKIG